ncbi:hypothetical protein SLE2022_090560 [Rubroshorea leprosula]
MAMSTSSVVPLLTTSPLSDLYMVSFSGRNVETVVTREPSTVDLWIRNVRSRQTERLIGLDIEWRPNPNPKINSNNPAATLQLCARETCLIVQLLYVTEIPVSLFDFMADPCYTFVGVGVGGDGKKLQKDYGLGVRNVVDLRTLGAMRWGRKDFERMGLKALAWEVLKWGMEKPMNVTLSPWDNDSLTYAQIQYACIDAFVSFELGRVFNACGSVPQSKDPSVH